MFITFTATIMDALDDKKRELLGLPLINRRRTSIAINSPLPELSSTSKQKIGNDTGLAPPATSASEAPKLATAQSDLTVKAAGKSEGKKGFFKGCSKLTFDPLTHHATKKIYYLKTM